MFKKAIKDERNIGQAPELKYHRVPTFIEPEKPKVEATIFVEPNKHMTVADLILALQSLPNQKELVWTEGCDCIGEASGIEYHPDRGLLITRLKGGR